MKSLFIVPCAILTSDQENENIEKIFQLLHTIDSILSRFNEAEILILELSGKKPEPAVYSIVETKGCRLISFYDNPKLHQIRESSKTVPMPVVDKARLPYERGYVKNLTEIMAILETLDTINPLDYQRIFKITGRYFISNKFDIDSHSIPSKITLKERSKCTFGKQYTGSDHVRHCMFYSFCPSIFDEVKKKLKDVEDYMKQQYSVNRLATIENGLEIFFKEDIIYEVKQTGAFGRVDNKYLHMD